MINRGDVMKALCRICTLMLVLVNAGWSQNLVPARIVGMDYPPLAVAAGVKGTLKIRCNVSQDGKVLSAEIIEASNSPAFDFLGKAVQKSLSQWLFPISTNVPPTTAILTYSFDLLVKRDPVKGSRFVFDSPNS